MRKVGMVAGVVVVLAACTPSINSDPGSVTMTVPATPTTAVELTTTTTAEIAPEPATEPTTIPVPVEFPEVVESSTTIVKVFTSNSGPSLAYGELATIRACESGGDYTTDTGNGYYGAYQFSWGTWASVGGSGNPAYASPSEQDMRAQMLIDAGYRSAWPNC